MDDSWSLNTLQVYYLWVLVCSKIRLQIHQFNTDDIIAQCGMLGLGDKVMLTSKQMEACKYSAILQMGEEPISKSELFRKLSRSQREVLNEGRRWWTYYYLFSSKGLENEYNDELPELLLGTRNLEVNVIDE